MDAKTYTSALEADNALVRKVATGQAYDYATNTAKASQLITPATPRVPSGSAPIWTLAPNNPLWSASHYGQQAWLLALVLTGLFEDAAEEFTPAQIMKLTGWGKKVWQNVISVVEGFFVEKVAHGRYWFIPSALASLNTESLPELPQWAQKGEQKRSEMRQTRENDSKPKPESTVAPSQPVKFNEEATKAALSTELDTLAINERLKWKIKL